MAGKAVSVAWCQHGTFTLCRAQSVQRSDEYFWPPWSDRQGLIAGVRLCVAGDVYTPHRALHKYAVVATMVVIDSGFVFPSFCFFSVLATTTIGVTENTRAGNEAADSGRSGMLDARNEHTYVVPVETMNGTVAVNDTCRLRAWSLHADEDGTAAATGSGGWSMHTFEDITAEVTGRGAHLLLYTLSFPEYDTDPLANMSRHHAANRWQRAFSSHGRALLSLGFNFEVLSLGLLRFGVERMHVKLVDAPYQCFGQETESAKIALILALLTTDFRSKPEVSSKLWRVGNNYVCYTTLAADDDGRAVFAPECCSRNADTGKADCRKVKPDTLVTVLLWVIAAAKIIFFLFGPLVLQHWIFAGSIRLQYYVVRLKQRMRKTILIKTDFMTDDSKWTVTSGRQKNICDFRNFRRLVKTLPSDEIVPIVFQSLHIQVTGLYNAVQFIYVSSAGRLCWSSYHARHLM